MRIIAIILCAATVSSTVQAIELACDGTSGYRIVISAKADVSTRAVADDMADLLQQISGATFAVVTDDTPAAAREIIIGHDNRRLAGIDTSGMAIGGYEIKTVGEKLMIAGPPPRGSINGMYGFLQDHLGCRYFTPGVTRLPRQATIELGDIIDRKNPAFRWRSINAPMHWDAGWTVRNRLNEAKTYGGSVSLNTLMDDPRARTLGNYYAAHAFSYVPRELYDEHPEFYMQQNARRVCHDDANERAYCVSNHDFARYMADRITGSLEPDDEPSRVGLGHADNGNFCRCEVCSTYYDTLGIAGTYLLFNNLVARHIAQRLPNVTVGTLVYGITFGPPPFKMQSNLFPTWCPISACYAHGFDECQANHDRGFIGQLKQWLDQTSQFGIWYYHHQSDALMPHPHVYATQKNMKLFRDMGVNGIFIEDTAGHTVRSNPVSDGDKLMPAYGDAQRNGYFTVAWGSNHLQSYIGARLLWNPDADVTQMIREFCETYYGRASGEMTDYFTTTQSIDAYERTLGTTFSNYPGVHLSGSQAPLMKWSQVERLDLRFDEAEDKVAGAPKLLRRVRLARLSLQLSILCFASADDPLREKVFVSFFALMEQMGFEKLDRTGATAERKTLAELKAIFSAPHKLKWPGQENVGDNLLSNSGMEVEMDADGIPDGWSASGKYNPEEYVLDSAEVRLADDRAFSGKRSVRLSKSPKSGHTVALRQKFDVTPGQAYRMHVRYQAQVATGKVVIIFTKFDKNGVERGHCGGNRGINDTAGKWLQMSATTTAEKDVAQLMAEFLFYDDQAEGVAWVDEFTCAKVVR